jgi:hypothetical protein
MQSIHFLGKVLPPSAQVTISFIPNISWDIDEFGLAAEFKSQIKNSNIDRQEQLQ